MAREDVTEAHDSKGQRHEVPDVKVIDFVLGGQQNESTKLIRELLAIETNTELRATVDLLQALQGGPIEDPGEPMLG